MIPRAEKNCDVSLGNIYADRAVASPSAAFAMSIANLCQPLPTSLAFTLPRPFLTAMRMSSTVAIARQGALGDEQPGAGIGFLVALSISVSKSLAASLEFKAQSDV